MLVYIQKLIRFLSSLEIESFRFRWKGEISRVCWGMCKPEGGKERGWWLQQCICLCACKPRLFALFGH